ncbi:hypothetical protein B0H11DRAFT_2083148 [Mycena galericulata]|nr:hypothetical protein B0H11DRAFT_2083148 [Mycena galericulata]
MKSGTSAFTALVSSSWAIRFFQIMATLIVDGCCARYSYRVESRVGISRLFLHFHRVQNFNAIASTGRTMSYLVYNVGGQQMVLGPTSIDNRDGEYYMYSNNPDEPSSGFCYQGGKAKARSVECLVRTTPGIF